MIATVLLLGTNDIQGLHCLIAATLHCGVSAHGLVLRLQQAIDGVYSPRGGFNQWDHDLAFLFQSIAGQRLLYACRTTKSHWLRQLQQSTEVTRLLPLSEFQLPKKCTRI